MGKAIACKNCRFFSAWEPSCRRHAPAPRYWAAALRDALYLAGQEKRGAVIDDEGCDQPWWPKVESDDWCGEFVEAADEEGDD